jgi:hypothetical protein
MMALRSYFCEEQPGGETRLAGRFENLAINSGL